MAESTPAAASRVQASSGAAGARAKPHNYILFCYITTLLCYIISYYIILYYITLHYIILYYIIFYYIILYYIILYYIILYYIILYYIISYYIILYYIILYYIILYYIIFIIVIVITMALHHLALMCLESWANASEVMPHFWSCRPRVTCSGHVHVGDLANHWARLSIYLQVPAFTIRGVPGAELLRGSFGSVQHSLKRVRSAKGDRSSTLKPMPQRGVTWDKKKRVIFKRAELDGRITLCIRLSCSSVHGQSLSPVTAAVWIRWRCPSKALLGATRVCTALAAALLFTVTEASCAGV